MDEEQQYTDELIDMMIDEILENKPELAEYFESLSDPEMNEIY